MAPVRQDTRPPPEKRTLIITSSIDGCEKLIHCETPKDFSSEDSDDHQYQQEHRFAERKARGEPALRPRQLGHHDLG